MMWDADRYVDALNFAAHAHGEQKSSGNNLPYVVHLCKVAMEVQRAALRDGFDVELAVTAALLHDCVEDTAVTVDDVARRFGPEVAAAVGALTKNETLPKAAQMADSLARIRSRPTAVWAVKLADRVTNLEPPPPHWSRERRQAYRDEAGVILTTLRGASPTLEARLAARIERYAGFVDGAVS
jgi:(p)ppGpp synthase/HD superfamily hydrolase